MGKLCITLVTAVLCLLSLTWGRSVVKRDVSSPKDQEDFLRDFGYYDDEKHKEPFVSAALTESRSEEAFTRAVKAFQRMAGLKITGEVDQDTLAKMNSPRCGVKDIPKKADDADGYVLQGSKWETLALTYKFLGYTPDLDKAVQRADIEKAFKVWSDETPLTFTENTDTADIEMKFASVDGPSNTLAYAYFPQYGGDVVFDEDETFSSELHSGINLLQVAAHEFGHSLGISHSDVQTALMAPYYSGYQPDFKLDPDDIAAIKKLYSPPTGGDICSDPLLDAIDYYEGSLYAFKGDKVMKIEYDSIVSGYPKLISESIFKDLPNDLDAALHWPDSFGEYAGTYFFKGSQYWKYGSSGLLQGFPRNIQDDFKGLPNDIDAAMVWGGNGKTYFMKGEEYYRFVPGAGVDDGYPLNTAQHWPGLPATVDAALQWENGKSYFFKGSQYYRYNDDLDKVDDGYPLNTGKHWLGC